MAPDTDLASDENRGKPATMSAMSLLIPSLDYPSVSPSTGSAPAPSHSPGTLKKQARHAYLEFFAGSGLVAQGLKTMFKPIWANDIDAKKAAVYTANHTGEHFHLGSIADVAGKDLPAAVLAWASFPCQDLSLAGLAGGIHGKRSGLVWEWLRIIDEMPEAPAILVAENVLGLVSASGGSHYRTLHAALAERGYKVGAMLLDAVRFVPHSRPRVFVVAVRNDVQVPGELTSPTPTWLHPAAVQKAASGLDSWVWWHMPEPPVRLSVLADIVEFDADYANTLTDERNIDLISPKHAALLNALPKKQTFVAPGYKRTRAGKQVLELRFDNVAGCLRTPGGGSSRQLLVIRNNGQLNSRLLTIKETARLMGAPESYQIPGSYNDGYKAMGDAVAVPVASWLARNLLLPLADLRDHTA
ncbi:DNA cytosine methyltransferase [Actimicrobium sp. CCC2.4]|uniref:DNA cytosine methyltransferase n=1 Tax=Actimicrobium sp. CCC2.4 TaxID=3048606 RepID=UPI002AC931D6|nr:DNA cytosine methyltransferase [Actimicrobium sp. CCC2.4]MEB0135709.1 DNA cytosine methyltransferase [Actimicrobium sp. CCC2.4]WPX33733.1 DNA cytosine methyltransferase [Actimicrobium sp. CCC2.4]